MSEDKFTELNARGLTLLEGWLAESEANRIAGSEFYASRARAGEFLSATDVALGRYVQQTFSPGTHRIIEMGCGLGPFLMLVGSLGFEATGFEASKRWASGAAHLRDALSAAWPACARVHFTHGVFPYALDPSQLNGTGERVLISTHVVSSHTAKHESPIIESFRRFDHLIIDIGSFGITRRGTAKADLVYRILDAGFARVGPVFRSGRSELIHFRNTLRSAVGDYPSEVRADLEAGRAMILSLLQTAFQPVIVIGMHRSGTSVIAETLHRLGVFMGDDQSSAHAESRFFMELNQFVFAKAHADWDNPLPVGWLLDDEALSDAVAAELLRRCELSGLQGFVGRDKAAGGSSAYVVKHWGWKDPRNTFTLPLWLRLFPKAKVIHVVRDGVAVAASLVVRELGRRTRLDSSARSCRCLSLERSFELWTEYVSMAEAICDGLPSGQRMTLQYESLLENPRSVLAEMGRFAGLSLDDEMVDSALAGIQPPRRDGRTQSGELRLRVADHPLMKKYGRDFESPGSTGSPQVIKRDVEPRVEVIIPTYMSGPWLDEAIESVIAQTYGNWHLTLVDDASPDDTSTRNERWRRALSGRCTLIVRRHRGGPAAARMDAVGQSQSDLLTFLDQDDRWRSQKLEEQVEYLRLHGQVKAVHTDIVVIDAEGEFIEGAADTQNAARARVPYARLSSRELALSLFRSYSIRIGSAAICRNAFNAVGGFDTDSALYGGEDWEFWVRFADAFSIGHLAIPLLERRAHDHNTSRVQYFRRTLGLFEALRRLSDTYPYLRPYAQELRERRISVAEWSLLTPERDTQDPHDHQPSESVVGTSCDEGS